MTVANNYAPIRQLGNGATTQFSAAWSMIAASYAFVQLEDSTTGVRTTVAQGVGSNQYQIAITSSGFTVTMGTAPTSSQYINVSRVTGLDQTNPYRTSKGFQGEVEEASFDKLTAMVQDARYSAGLAVTIPVGETYSTVLPSAANRAGRFLAFDGSGNVIVSTLVTTGTLYSNIISAAPAVSDTNVLAQGTYSVNSYVQEIIQNTSSGAAASADFVVNNNLGTASTYYGNFGMNSSGFTGSGAFNKASSVYLTATSGDLAIGTTTANAIHFVYNNSTTDSAYIDATGFNTYSMNGGQLAGFRNRIINGDMRIDQRNAGAAVVPNGYCLDRWSLAQSVTGKMTTAQNQGGVAAPTGFANYLGIKTTTAYSPVSTDAFVFYQQIEGYNVQDFNWGSANAKSLTLSFWVYSSLTGNFGAFVQNANGGAPRAYPFLYNIPVANTWTKITQTIPGDVTGTWNVTTGIGIGIAFSMGAGSGTLSAPGAWNTANAQGVTGQTNVVATLNAVWDITGVQVETGSVATAFEQRNYASELAMCQRYYFDTNPGSSTYVVRTGGYAAGAGGVAAPPFYLPVSMRALPTVTTRNVNFVANANQLNLQTEQGLQNINFWFAATGAGAIDVRWNLSASAEL